MRGRPGHPRLRRGPAAGHRGLHDRRRRGEDGPAAGCGRDEVEGPHPESAALQIRSRRSHGGNDPGGSGRGLGSDGRPTGRSHGSRHPGRSLSRPWLTRGRYAVAGGDHPRRPPKRCAGHRRRRLPGLPGGGAAALHRHGSRPGGIRRQVHRRPQLQRHPVRAGRPGEGRAPAQLRQL